MSRLRYLLRQYADKQISEAEMRELGVLLEKDWDAIAPGVEVPNIDWGRMLAAIKAEGGHLRAVDGAELVRPVRRVRALWYRSAAAVLILLGAGVVYYSTHQKRQEAIVVSKASAADVLPGGNKAVLTLAGGRQIILDSARQGDLVTEGDARVSKVSSGRLSYRRVGDAAGAVDAVSGVGAVAHNTLSTPRGGQYQLTLSDGTVVWLNAASSITYPTAFTGKLREVSITGEAYFEVNYKANQPFRVRVGNDTIEDLGTHFNINAYPDEPGLKTTLLEGRVRVDAAGGRVILKPGEQAVSQLGGSLTVRSSVDVDEAVAWKNGLFQFDRADIQTVMRQLARWYNVDVKFEGAVSPDRFWGKLPRDLNASQVLKVLQKEQVHFRIQGKTIIVTQ